MTDVLTAYTELKHATVGFEVMDQLRAERTANLERQLERLRRKEEYLNARDARWAAAEARLLASSERLIADTLALIARLKAPKRCRRNAVARCGAETRDGSPCEAPPVWDKAHARPVNGRCRRHGGLTPAGRARAPSVEGQRLPE